jgi:exonuclease SbcD
MRRFGGIWLARTSHEQEALIGDLGPDALAVILGDTPSDAAAADAVGFPFLAVATGVYDESALRATSAVVVVPDLERGLPAVLDALGRLADVAPVIAIPGNHDSAVLFGVLAPYLEASGVQMIDRINHPDQGGVREVPSKDGRVTAQVACMPFLHETQTVDFVEPTEEWYKSYADRVRKITAAYAGHMAARSRNDTVDVLVGHFMVDGAVPSGSERELHIGDAFMATSASIPPGIKYGALGHIHLTQRAPGSDHAWYAGSLMQLDFGEAGQDKNVLVADVAPDKPGARVEPIPLTSGRRLRDVRATVDQLEKDAASYGDDILRITVPTGGPEPGLADHVREFLPSALYVKAEYERVEADVSARSGRSLDELYREYVVATRGAQPPPELMEAFIELCGAAEVQV